MDSIDTYTYQWKTITRIHVDFLFFDCEPEAIEGAFQTEILGDFFKILNEFSLDTKT